MKFIRGFIYSMLVLSAFGYSATLTLQSGCEADQAFGKRVRPMSKQDLLTEHLPQQIVALSDVQRAFQVTIDAERERNPLRAFNAACSLATIQALTASVQDVLTCLQMGGQSASIAIGATPAVQQGIAQLIMHLDTAGIASDPLKRLSLGFQEITRDIPNPELPGE